MKRIVYGLIFTLFLAQALKAEVPVYLDQSKSLIKWDQLEEKEWLDFYSWKKDLKEKEETPNWEQIVRDRDLIEDVGRVIACVGDCRIYRGETSYSVTYRSDIKEGDELLTTEDSYVWVFLFDGTLVRLAPDSSISFKEINVGVEENFLHVRMNAGNIFWMNRVASPFKDSQLKETDTLFLPLKLHDANPRQLKREFKDDELFKYLENDGAKISQYERLNADIEKNNKWIKKKTKSFIVLPNGNVVADNLIAEFIVLLGGKSYFKVKNERSVNLTYPYLTEVKFTFRGFENLSKEGILPNIWYEVDERGREIHEMNEPREFRIGEYVTKRIPSILQAREILLDKYSHFAHSILDREKLAKEHGYRLWQVRERQEEESDLDKRINFLTEYTRRIETTNLMASRKIKERMTSRGETIMTYEYNNRFYKKALANYFITREAWREDQEFIEDLNSTKKKLWKNMHGIYR